MTGGTTCELLPGNANLLPSAPGGGSCTAVFGAASAPVTEARACLGTLKAMLTSGCAQGGLLVPCYCGQADPAGCQAGTAAPEGPLVPEFDCDFGTTDAPTVFNDLSVSGNLGAAGAANIVQCLAAAAACPTPCPLH